MPPVGASRIATVTARAGEDASLAGNARIGTLTARFRGVVRGDVASRVVGGFVTNRRFGVDARLLRLRHGAEGRAAGRG